MTSQWVNDVAMNVHCEIIMGHDIVMGKYHDLTMHTVSDTDVAQTLNFYILLCQIMIFLFSLIVKSLKFN